MINHAKLRAKLGKFDVSLSRFSEMVELAVDFHSKDFLKTPLILANFISEEEKQEAIADAEDSIKQMSWEEIKKLVVDAEVLIEMSADDKKVEDMQFDEKVWRTSNGQFI